MSGGLDLYFFLVGTIFSLGLIPFIFMIRLTEKINLNKYLKCVFIFLISISISLLVMFLALYYIPK